MGGGRKIISEIVKRSNFDVAGILDGPSDNRRVIIEYDVTDREDSTRRMRVIYKLNRINTHGLCEDLRKIFYLYEKEGRTYFTRKDIQIYRLFWKLFGSSNLTIDLEDDMFPEFDSLAELATTTSPTLPELYIDNSDDVMIYLNGILQSTADYNIDENKTITFNNMPASGDEIEVIYGANSRVSYRAG